MSVEALREFIEERGLTIRDAAEQARISAAKLSQVLNNRYKSSTEEAKEILKRLQQEDKEFLTRSQAAMCKVLEWTMEDRQMALICGPSGVGKTHTVNRFSEGKKIFVYRPTELSSPGGMLRDMGLCLGIKVYGSNEERLRRIINEIKSRFDLVIVDEADVLCESRQWASVVKKMSVFRQIMEAGVGVALVGLPVLEEAVRQMPGYFQNRIGYFLEVTVKKDEIEKFISLFANGMERKWVEFACEKAMGGGYFRFLKMFCEKGAFLGWEAAGQIIYIAR